VWRLRSAALWRRALRFDVRRRYFADRMVTRRDSVRSGGACFE
jgi:hypothetical protein